MTFDVKITFTVDISDFNPHFASFTR